MWTDTNEQVDQGRNRIFQMATVFFPDQPFSLESKEDLAKLRTEIYQTLMAADNLIKKGTIA